MKRHRRYKEIFYQIMKITLGQCLLLLFCMQLSFAENLRAQEILSQRISITVNDMDMEKVLEMIEGQTKVRFVYSAEIIGADRKVTMESQNQRLDTVLENLLNPLGIEYKVSKRTILLKKAATEKKASLIVEPQQMKAEAFDRDITGKVIDDKGAGIPGVSVVVKGTTQGTSTNIDGNYQLSIPRK